MQNYIKLHKKADAAEIKIRVRKKCQIREKVEVDQRELANDGRESLERE